MMKILSVFLGLVFLGLGIASYIGSGQTSGRVIYAMLAGAFMIVSGLTKGRKDDERNVA